METATARLDVPRTEIVLDNVGRRFNSNWIFRHLSHSFHPDEHTVILGPNGSGKSTLLQVILGSLSASEGTVNYSIDERSLSIDDTLGLFSIATPYLELTEEFTLREMLAFHGSLMPFRDGLTCDEIVRTLYLDDAADRQLKYYSSGMRQRVKLGLALLSDTPFVLLDEPTSNLDSRATDWYAQLVTDNMEGRTIIVCSNTQELEYFFCRKSLSVVDGTVRDR